MADGGAGARAEVPSVTEADRRRVDLVVLFAALRVAVIVFSSAIFLN